MIPPMMSPTKINKQLSGTTEGSLFYTLTYLGQGCQHDPEGDLEGHLDMLIIQGEECVLRGLIPRGLLGCPADVLQGHVLQQRLLQGSHPRGLEKAGEQGPSQDSGCSLLLHLP
ncbi:hypothetical protein N305_05432, partial [Manacus vitellinus]